MIRQGDVYRADLPPSEGSEPRYREAVVVRNPDLTEGRGRTAIVCALSSDLRCADTPGAVRLDDGEAGVVGQRVVDVSQLFTVDRLQLRERVGRLSGARVRQILDGIYLWLEPRELG